MRKITISIIAICLILMGSMVFAAGTDISTITGINTQLSDKVKGVYFANINASGDYVDFAISTANTQGDEVYATGNFVSKIFCKNIAGDTYVSTDLLQSVSNYNSSASFTSWTCK
ncbi:hypothetical protein [Flexistipes sinusarabici]|nr:hypothetical protein [Flexistipes sinusarabici]